MNRFLAAVATAIACAVFASTFEGCSYKEHSPKTIYLVVGASTEAQKQIAEDMLHELTRKVNPSDTVIVDILSQDKAVNLLSASDAGKALKEIEGGIAVQPATDEALVDAANRATLIAKKSKKLQCIFFVEGTSDRGTITKLSYNIQNLAEQPSFTGISLIGIKPKYRLPLSQAFSSMPGETRMVSLDAQWPEIIQDVVK